MGGGGGGRDGKGAITMLQFKRAQPVCRRTRPPITKSRTLQTRSGAERPKSQLLTELEDTQRALGPSVAPSVLLSAAPSGPPSVTPSTSPSTATPALPSAVPSPVPSASPSASPSVSPPHARPPPLEAVPMEARSFGGHCAPIWPSKGPAIRMLQFKQLEPGAAAPPALLGVETSGPVFSAAQRAACLVLRALFDTTDIVWARVLLLWGDATVRTTLDEFHDVIAGGKGWRKLEARKRVDLRWVHLEEATDKSFEPMYWHREPGPLLLFQTGVGSGSPTSLTLQLASCSNILDLFPMGSLERRRIGKWEGAAAAGTAQAWLGVTLDANFTLREALEEGWESGRHGPLHIRWMVHVLSVASKLHVSTSRRR